jgi:endonuclease/exonuclease/phosphatase family metal-dependent hydrolase
MGRGIVWALAEQEGREVLFTTTHLESFLGEDNNGGPEREVQLEEMVEFCNRCMRERSTLDLAIITGDLNWDDERPRSQGHNRPLMSLLDSTKWIDTYREAEPTGRGYTYDPVENPMLGGGNIRRRFDRILVQRPVGKAEVDTVELVGTEAIPDISYMTPRTRFRKPQRKLVAPSDHFGLVTKLKF